MYTSIIHEKEKQHSVLIKNSEAYQQVCEYNSGYIIDILSM